MARVVKTDTQAASKRMLSTKRSLRLRATLDRANCASLASPVSGGFDMVRSGVVEVAVIVGISRHTGLREKPCPAQRAGVQGAMAQAITSWLRGPAVP